MVSADRAAFEVHLAACGTCRDEVAAFRGVQGQLDAWVPPTPGVLPRPDVRQVGQVLHVPPSRWGSLREVPTWARAAAAVVAIGVASGVAHLDVRYGSDGVSVRTGWLRSGTAVGAVPGSDADGSVAWRADLAASEERLRAELRRIAEVPGRSADAAGAVRAANSGGDIGTVASASDNSAPANALANKDVMARMRALVADSERRQQRELALRVAEVFRDVQTQRQSDLVRIDRSLGLLQNSTGIEVARQREAINSLAVRVSQRQ